MLRRVNQNTKDPNQGVFGPIEKGHIEFCEQQWPIS